MASAVATAADSADLQPREGAGDFAPMLRLIPLTLLAYSVLLPLEMRIVLNEQVIYPSRAAVFIVTPFILHSLAMGSFRLRAADGLVFLAVGWMVASFINTYGPGQGIIRGGALALDHIGPYLVARLCIRSIDDLRRLLVLLAPGAFLAGLSTFAESFSGTPIIRPIAASIFGELPLYEGGEAVGERPSARNFRFGLLRSAGPFAHPIYAGLFLSSLLPLYFMSGLRKWPGKLGTLTAGFSFFSLSSAAILGLLIGIAMIAYDKLQKLVSFLNWHLFALFALLGVAFLQIASQSGIVSILIRLTLNPQTGFYRLLIWRYGIQSIENHPLFGIGFAAYERPNWMNSSVDSYWLLLGIRHGIVVPLALFLVSVLAVFALSRSAAMRDELDRRAIVGVVITLVSLIIAAFTVAFVGGILTWFMLILGASLTLSHAIER